MYHCHLICLQNFFISQTETSHPLYNHFPPSPSLPIPLSISMDFTAQNLTAVDSSRICPPVTSPSVLAPCPRAHPRCSMCQNFIPSEGSMYSTVCKDALCQSAFCHCHKVLERINLEVDKVGSEYWRFQARSLSSSFGPLRRWQDKTTHLLSQGAKGKETGSQDPLSRPHQ